jgi:hypothetical protein
MRQILIEKYIEPSESINRDDGRFTEFWVNQNGDLHNFMGHPSEIRYYNGKIGSQAWHKKGIQHRERGLPAEICYNLNGQIAYKGWFKNGEFIKKETF